MNAIEFHNVSVHYRRRRAATLKEYLVRGLGRNAAAEDFSALRDINLEIPQGQTLGIVGGNGAGKSTLLRVAAGIIVPTAGEAITRGVLAPLIELGTGFDLELSGRENIYFNGSLLGRSKAMMAQRLDEIVEFADLGEFIDAPIRTYSTGMVARLAFSIATTVDADVILLDEILSVGDSSFKEKCEERIERFCERGSTVVLVSHDMAAITRLCDRAIWLHHGKLRADGPSRDVVETYQRLTYIETHPEQFPDYDASAEFP